MTYVIPDDLTLMLRDRRVIPFVGAGFSATQGFPVWESMLKSVAAEIDPNLSFDELSGYCQHDPLQIAEYLYLKAGGSIGPLRYSISTLMRSDKSPVRSTAHVELVNLDAPRVYTTNFDDLIERTYRALGLPVEVIALPRDIATSQTADAQVVKYHGDLRHDATLVLTESQYYARLDFESPMDLKFRSDLLGRSVLFIGYGFRDINIRVIWFKLMNMMRDVPVESRPVSYVVRLNENPVLDELYRAVGIRTIVLDPDNDAKTEEARSELLAHFVLDLSLRLAPRASGTRFLSLGLLDRVEAALPAQRNAGRSLFTGDALRTFGALAARRVPDELVVETEQVLLVAARRVGVQSAFFPTGSLFQPLAIFAANFVRSHGQSNAAGLLFSLGILREQNRAAALSPQFDDIWPLVWRSTWDDEDVERIVRIASSEMNGHENESIFDDDIAYCVDVMSRLASGLCATKLIDEREQEINGLLARAADLYPSVSDYSPEGDKPQPTTLLHEVAARRQELQPEDEGDDVEVIPVFSADDDDIPF